ncbi:hypothetical protein G8A07_18425 [Roseateles sp. DAIF2]|uniref:hypothetical protein n=1 Tax=Roseateles sp. DAIF2 TaxID=2714952 RepID=UPI0018A265CB|nr:hypothetical protein [Roseateles sp. DAIF2]QPF74700.1 hypothetical protein G8A07_18425 [Roseateles sp. DAIF2]
MQQVRRSDVPAPARPGHGPDETLPAYGIMARSQQLLRSLAQGRQLSHSLDGLEVQDSTWDDYLDCCSRQKP